MKKLLLRRYVVPDNCEVHVFGHFTPDVARTFFSHGATALYTFGFPLPDDVMTNPCTQSLGVLGDVLLQGDLDAQERQLTDEFNDGRRKVLTAIPARLALPQTNTGEVDIFEAHDEDYILFVDWGSFPAWVSRWRGKYFFCLYHESEKGVLHHVKLAADHPEYGLPRSGDIARIAAVPNVILTSAWTKEDIDWVFETCPDIGALGLIYFDPALSRSPGKLNEFVSRPLELNLELLDLIRSKRSS